MPFMNTVILMGNLGAAPEVHYTADGNAVCTLRIASNEVWNNQEGQKQEHTEWHRVVLFGPQAENISKYGKKGQLVHVEGRLRTREYQVKQEEKLTVEGVGEMTIEVPVTKYVTEIISRRSQILSPIGKESAGISKQESDLIPEADHPPF